MRSYDSSKPLIFLHIPKTGGVSVRSIVHRWYGDGFISHYHGSAMPPLRDLSKPPFSARPTVIFGHFNSRRGFGADNYYPEAEQFVTILRDPWERALSGYFYARRMNKQNGSFPEYAEMSLESHLTKDPPNSIANHFPKFCNLNNYREVIERYFIEIGLTEMLDHSLARISAKLGFELLADELQTLNSTDRGTDIPDNLKARFIESHQFDYTIYNYIRSGFHPQ